jgi:hypothetical protein
MKYHCSFQCYPLRYNPSFRKNELSFNTFRHVQLVFLFYFHMLYLGQKDEACILFSCPYGICAGCGPTSMHVYWVRKKSQLFRDWVWNSIQPYLCWKYIADFVYYECPVIFILFLAEIFVTHTYESCHREVSCSFLEVPCSNVGRQTDYVEWGSWLSSGPPNKCWDTSLNYFTTVSFHILSIIP